MCVCVRERGSSALVLHLQPPQPFLTSEAKKQDAPSGMPQRPDRSNRTAVLHGWDTRTQTPTHYFSHACGHYGRKKHTQPGEVLHKTTTTTTSTPMNNNHNHNNHNNNNNNNFNLLTSVLQLHCCITALFLLHAPTQKRVRRKICSRNQITHSSVVSGGLSPKRFGIEWLRSHRTKPSSEVGKKNKNKDKTRRNN